MFVKHFGSPCNLLTLYWVKPRHLNLFTAGIPASDAANLQRAPKSYEFWIVVDLRMARVCLVINFVCFNYRLYGLVISLLLCTI